MNYLKTFIGAVLAGMAIAIGGLAFLSVDSKVLGSALFTVGLFTVCTMGLNLFTGKVCYVFQNDRDYALALPVIWIGNLAGTGLIALFAGLTRNAPALAEKAAGMCQVKLDDNLVSLFFLGILCNILIYIGVEGYKNIPHEIGKYLNQYVDSLPKNEYMIFCGNTALNALLNYYVHVTSLNEIDFKLHISIPEHLPVSDVDLCSMVGNIMENAVIACQSVEEKTIELTILSEKRMQLYIVVVNSFNGVARQRDGRYVSTKADGSGVGLASVAATAENYGGVAQFSHEGKLFTAI